MTETSETKRIRNRYNRTAFYYDWMDRMISPSLRKRALSYAHGDCLEAGVGTGANLPYYPSGCSVTGIDISPGMLSRAHKKIERASVPIKLLEMDAQNLAFADETFDTVLSACVFCSVPNPVKGLTEMRRVCKKDGTIILLEHVRSDHPVVGKIMDFLNPVSLYLVGSNINRRTMENIQLAGIEAKQVENHHGKIVKLIISKR